MSDDFGGAFFKRCIERQTVMQMHLAIRKNYIRQIIFEKLKISQTIVIVGFIYLRINKTNYIIKYIKSLQNTIKY